jgi:hypothetical protein
MNEVGGASYVLRSVSSWRTPVFGHPFAYLRAMLGAPARTFRYVDSGAPNVEDHVWRCGCAARESAGACELIACDDHGSLERVSILRTGTW